MADPTAGEVRQHAKDILQRAEFGRHESILQKVWNWIGDLFGKITFGLGGGSGFLGNLVALALVAGIVFVIVLLVRALLGHRAAGAGGARRLDPEARRRAQRTTGRATPTGSRPRGSGRRRCGPATAK